MEGPFWSSYRAQRPSRLSPARGVLSSGAVPIIEVLVSPSGSSALSGCSTDQFPPSPQVVSSEKALCEYSKADICVALCRMVAYNIGQLAHLNATRHGIKRILFGGFFIRGHPYTMETISYAINFWSKVRRASAGGTLRGRAQRTSSTWGQGESQAVPF